MKAGFGFHPVWEVSAKVALPVLCDREPCRPATGASKLINGIEVSNVAVNAHFDTGVPPTSPTYEAVVVNS